MTGQKQFEWTEKQSTAFEALKQALSSPPVLALPNLEDEFILDTDASDFAIGAELLQVQGGVEKVIAYGSFALTKEQRRYCTTRKELLAVVRFTRQFRHYLLGKPFMVRTDHSSLRWLMRFKEPQGQLARWLEELSQYNMVLRHRPGRDHCNADALSRKPAYPGECGAYGAGRRLEELPCGGCRYCARAHENWAAFTDDVDEAVPLASNTLPLEAHVAAASVSSGSQLAGNSIQDSPYELSSERCDDSGKPGNTSSGPPRNCAEEVIFELGEAQIEEQQHWSEPDQCQEDVQILEEVLAQIPWEVENPDASSEVVSLNIVTTRRQAKKAEEVARNPEQPPTKRNRAEEEARNPEQPPSNGNRADEEAREPGQPPTSSDDGHSSTTARAPTDQDTDSSTNGNRSSTVGSLASWGHSVEELKRAQAEDDSLKVLMDWMRDVEDPDASKLFRASPAAKHYWLNRELFFFIDEVLYWNDPDSGDKKLVLPESMRKTAMGLNHNLPSAGHQGATRTRERLKERYYWYGMKRDVTGYVAGCEVCNQNKKSDRQGRCGLTEYQAGAPMERVHVDFLGPLPKTARGH